VTFSVAAQVLSGATADGGVGRDANESVEQGLHSLVFGGAGASPEFGRADRGEKDHRVRAAELEPLGYNGPVPAARDLDQYVGIG